MFALRNLSPFAWPAVCFGERFKSERLCMTEFIDSDAAPNCSGYVLIHRKLFKNPAFRNEFEAMAFAWLVTKASWRDVTVRYKERPIKLQRGQLAVSVRDMAAKLDRNRQWVERFMSRLSEAAIIETATETGINVVTICNYDVYQRPWDSAETAPRQDRDRTETQNNEGNKDNEVNKGKEIKKASAFILPDWIDEGAWADWETYRQQLKKPLTDRSRALSVGVLKEAKTAGFSPKQAIDHAIMSGWRGLYVPNGKPKSETELQYPTPPEYKTRRAFIDAFCFTWVSTDWKQFDNEPEKTKASMEAIKKQYYALCKERREMNNGSA